MALSTDCEAIVCPFRKREGRCNVDGSHAYSNPLVPVTEQRLDVSVVFWFVLTEPTTAEALYLKQRSPYHVRENRTDTTIRISLNVFKVQPRSYRLSTGNFVYSHLGQVTPKIPFL